MKLLKITLETTCLEEMKAFYHKFMELPILEDSEDYFTVEAGKTRLTFIHSEQKPYYHAAFRTGAEHFHHMYQKLEKLGVLIENEHGETSMFWKGKQLYFHDPEGNIMEILERPHPATKPVKGFYDIGEIGLPTPNLNEFSHFLSSVPNEFPSHDSEFRFFGGNDGVFVLAKTGRPWYPNKKRAYESPVTVEVASEDGSEQRLFHPTLPYKIKIKPLWKSKSLPVYQVRIARSTDQWEEVLAFYEKGIGLERIGSFENHDGYDGVMLGLPSAAYHLEFTRHEDGHPCPAPTDDNLLVFYLTDQKAYLDAQKRMKQLGYHPIPPVNPYWVGRGVTFRDPDGWRVVFCLGTGI